MTETEVELTTAEIASQQGTTTKTINEWRRRAELTTGNKLGVKRGKTTFFNAGEVQLILNAQSSADRRNNPPQQVWESLEEDSEGASDAGFMVLATAQNEMVDQVRSALALARQQEQLIEETIAAYLHPQNRMARVLSGVATRLGKQQSSELSDVLSDALMITPAHLLPDADSKRRLCECI